MEAQNYVDTPKELTHISLCAGYGGIDLGLHRVYGERLRTIAFSEIEAFAVENLVSKMEAGLLPPAPVWTDLRTFPWADFRGVDLLSGGFPCQPFSAAGKRNADSDPRHLFPAILEGIRHAQPRLVFLENVEGIISAKLAGDGWRDPAGTPVLLHVLRELERVGYCPTAGLFSASETGAPHQRKRTFILAYRICDGHDWRELQDRVEGWPSGQLPQPHTGESCGVWSETGGCGQVWPSRPGEPQHAWEPPRVVGNSTQRQDHGREPGDVGTAPSQWRRGDHAADGTGEVLGNAGSQRPGTLGAESAGQQRQASITSTGVAMGNPYSPRPQERPRQRGAGIQGTHADGGADAERQTQPSLGGDAHGASARLDEPGLPALGDPELAEIYDWMVRCTNRTDELRLLGNGVCVTTGELAYRTLFSELCQNN